MFAVNNEILEIDEKCQDDSVFHQFNSMNSKKIKELKGNKFPKEILKERNRRLEKNIKYRKISRKMKRASVYDRYMGVLATDNSAEEYHMVVSPEKLQIRKFEFVKKLKINNSL